MSQHEPTRRSVIRAGVWSAPLVVAASAAPAFAASGGISGTHQAQRLNLTDIRATGTCSNAGPAAVSVTLEHTWLCDGTGSAPGEFSDISAGPTFSNGWTILSRAYVPGDGNPRRGLVAVFTRSVGGGETVPLPDVVPFLPTRPESAAVTGTQFTSFSAPGVTVTQPAPVGWAAFTGTPRGPGSSRGPVSLLG